jgi:hypothetical protein
MLTKHFCLLGDVFRSEIPKLHRIQLEPEQRFWLMSLIQTREHSAQTQRRALTLVLSDEAREDGGWSDTAIAESLNVSIPTAERTRHEWHQRGRASLEREQ